MSETFKIHRPFLLMSFLALTGCEFDNDGSTDDTETLIPPAESAGPDPVPTPAAAAAPAPVSFDELDISHAESLGTHAGKPAQNAKLSKLLYVANRDGDHVNLSFDPLNWPTRNDGGKKLDGGVYIYWVEGARVRGGLFDFHAVGQTAKTLENVHGGYLDGRRPPRGAPIWFTIVSLDGSRRTSVKKSNTNW